jgi:hypothetical protein
VVASGSQPLAVERSQIEGDEVWEEREQVPGSLEASPVDEVDDEAVRDVVRRRLFSGRFACSYGWDAGYC